MQPRAQARTLQEYSHADPAFTCIVEESDHEMSPSMPNYTLWRSAGPETARHQDNLTAQEVLSAIVSKHSRRDV